MAGTLPAVVERRQDWRLLAANLAHPVATLLEGAAGGQTQQVGRIARNGGQHFPFGIEAGNGAQQTFGVWVARAIEDIVYLAVLHGTTGIHHQHLVADTGDHAKVMGDHDDGGVELALELVHQGHDLGLHGHVERGGRLIGDQQLRPAEQCHGDHHPLAHTAGELMGVHSHPLARFGDLHRVQHPHRLLERRRLVHPLVQHQHFHQLILHLHVRVERGHWVLEDHGDLLGADLVELGLGEVEDLFALKFGGTGDHAVLGQQAHDGKRGLGFAGAGLADDPQGFTGGERKVEVVDRHHIAIRGFELDPQIFDIQ